MVSMPPGLWPESTSMEPSLSLSMTRSTLCLEAFLGKDSFILLSHKYTSVEHQPRVSDLRIYFLGSESVKSSWLFEKESLASGTTQKPSWFSLLKNFPWWPGAQMEMLLQTNIMIAIIFQISPTCSRGFVFLGIWAPAQGILIGECEIQQAQSLRNVPWVLKENMAQGGCCLPLVHACSWTWLVGCVPWTSYSPPSTEGGSSDSQCSNLSPGIPSLSSPFFKHNWVPPSYLLPHPVG